MFESGFVFGGMRVMHLLTIIFYSIINRYDIKIIRKNKKYILNIL